MSECKVKAVEMIQSINKIMDDMLEKLTTNEFQELVPLLNKRIELLKELLALPKDKVDPKYLSAYLISLTNRDEALQTQIKQIQEKIRTTTNNLDNIKSYTRI